VINYTLKQEVFVEKYFRLGSPSAKGWRQNLTGCPYCHDGKSKNPRSHFLFINEEIGFQCFNCGAKHRFSGTNVSGLAKFISKSAWKKQGAVMLELKKEKIFPNTDLKNQEELKEEVGEDNLELIDYKEVELPDVSIKITTKKDKIAPRYRSKFLENKEKVKKYLKEHGLEDLPQAKDLYICMEGDYSNRLIFPIYFDGKLISWAARALFPTKTKYLYPPAEDEFNERGRIIYGLDKLFKAEDVKQIFVTESLTDAWILGGMAVLSKNITDDQINILKHFNFQKKNLLFVLDKDKINFKWDTDLKGLELGKAVLKEKQPNWNVSYPLFTTPAKDVGESYEKFGWLETYDKIMSNIVKGNTNLTLKSKLANVGVGKKRRSLTKG
jgi:hypothetical protein